MGHRANTNKEGMSTEMQQVAISSEIIDRGSIRKGSNRACKEFFL